MSRENAVTDDTRHAIVQELREEASFPRGRGLAHLLLRAADALETSGREADEWRALSRSNLAALRSLQIKHRDLNRLLTRIENERDEARGEPQ